MFLDNEIWYFSGWPNRYFGYKTNQWFPVEYRRQWFCSSRNISQVTPKIVILLWFCRRFRSMVSKNTNTIFFHGDLTDVSLISAETKTVVVVCKCRCVCFDAANRDADCRMRPASSCFRNLRPLWPIWRIICGLTALSTASLASRKCVTT